MIQFTEARNTTAKVIALRRPTRESPILGWKGSRRKLTILFATAQVLAPHSPHCRRQQTPTIWQFTDGLLKKLIDDVPEIDLMSEQSGAKVQKLILRATLFAAGPFQLFAVAIWGFGASILAPCGPIFVLRE